MTKTRGFCNDSMWFNKYEEVDQIFSLQLPELLSTSTFCRSTTSSACPSDDSGIEHTLNLSPASPFSEDTDSDDIQSLGGFETRSSVLSYQSGHNHTTPNSKNKSLKVQLYPDIKINAKNYPKPSRFVRPWKCTSSAKDISCHSLKPKVKPNVIKPNRNKFQLLGFDQVTRLNEVLSKEISIHSCLAGFPTIHVQLRELLRVVRENLKSQGLVVRDMRLNGGAASYVISKFVCQVLFYILY